jgi:TolB-like protein
LSPEKDQEYFCDGMTEQIISNLAKLPRLKVIARTSVLKYKKTEKTIPEIGKELNVAHILEGSIRKFGNRIRVTAQLIKTNDGFHVWSEDFERKKKLEESWYLRLKNHQLYDFLRSDPRFQEILSKHKELYEENLRKYGDID